MRILVTGSNGYIGKNLIPVLLEAGHHVIAMVRFEGIEIPKHHTKNIELITADLLNSKSLESLPKKIDIAYYLVHSMSDDEEKFEKKELTAAKNFIRAMETRQCKQLIYLSGLCHGKKLSRHLKSRLSVEKVLIESDIPTTVLRSGIIVGAGSASFEIIRDLVEKLPLMIAPKWVYNRCQPIALHDIIFYLSNVILQKKCLNKVFDVGGPDKLTFKEVLLELANIRNLKRVIIPVPVLTPKLSSYWLYFVTATHFGLAKYLVESMNTSLLCRNNDIEKILNHTCISYRESLSRVFTLIEENAVISSWKDNWETNITNPNLNSYIKVPQYGCFKDEKFTFFTGDINKVTDKLWKIGGENGWYYMNWAWNIRGFIDKLFGGVGIRRGRRHPTEIKPGDCLDFWRVITADSKHRRLLLYAEMKVPGEAWLEFEITKQKTGNVIRQCATFRPNGLFGRFYWYAMLPFHLFLFRGMIQEIVNAGKES